MPGSKRSTPSQSQKQIALPISKKRQNQSKSTTNPKKARVEPSKQNADLSVSQKNHAIPPVESSSQDPRGSTRGNQDSSPQLRNSTSHSTLENEEGEDELDDFEAEEAALANGATSVSQTQKKSGKDDTAVEATPVKVSEDQRAKFDELSTRCRLVYLARFKLMPHASIIRHVWGDSIQKKSWEWNEANNRLNWNGSNWKVRSIRNMQLKIKEYIEHDDSGALQDTTETKPLGRFFATKYSPSAFGWVFEWASSCVDIASSDEYENIHFYLKNIWVNFAVRVKLYTDWEADPQALFASPHSRKKLLEWIPVMAKSDRYNVRPEDFVVLESKERRARKGSPGPVEPDDDENYLFLGTPPPSPPASAGADA